jgi:hypothetical protein
MDATAATVLGSSAHPSAYGETRATIGDSASPPDRLPAAAVANPVAAGCVGADVQPHAERMISHDNSTTPIPRSQPAGR